MLLVATVLIVLAVGYSQYSNGLFSSVAMLLKVVLSGMVAFNYCDPIADALDPILGQGQLAGCEDFLVLTSLFSLSLLVLRITTNYLAPDMITEHGYLQFVGASCVGFITGYLVAGFLVCAIQTLPLDERFLDYEPRSASESPLRTLIPPDRVWLSLMRHASAVPLAPASTDDSKTFDQHATFELRFLRYRRGFEGKGPMPYQGEFDIELGKQK